MTLTQLVFAQILQDQIVGVSQGPFKLRGLCGTIGDDAAHGDVENCPDSSVYHVCAKESVKSRRKRMSKVDYKKHHVEVIMNILRIKRSTWNAQLVELQA